jgi:hypothetical protein
MIKYLLLLALPISINAQISSDGLIFHAPFSGNYSDVSGNNVLISNLGASFAQDRDGLNNNAVSFDGDASYLTVNQNISIINTTNFTISSWAKMNGNGGGNNSQNAIFEQRDDDATPSSKSAILLISRFANNQSYFSVRSSTGGSSVIILADNAPANDTWHHYCATKCDNSINLYIDGQLVGTTPYTQSGNFTTSVDHVSIGAHHNTDNQTYGAFNGSIDEFRIYNKCLTSDEVRDIYTDNFVAIKELEKGIEFNVFPNPTSGAFSLQLPEKNDASIVEVYDLIGNHVITIKLDNTVSKHDLKINSSNGIYYLRILNDEKKQLGYSRVIKQ